MVFSEPDTHCGEAQKLKQRLMQRSHYIGPGWAALTEYRFHGEYLTDALTQVTVTLIFFLYSPPVAMCSIVCFYSNAISKPSCMSSAHFLMKEILGRIMVIISR